MKDLVNKVPSLISGVALLFLFSCADKEKDVQPEFTTLPQKATTWQNNSEVISLKQLSYDGNGAD